MIQASKGSLECVGSAEVTPVLASNPHFVLFDCKLLGEKIVLYYV